MSKNIALFIDGTEKDGHRSGQAKSNVWTLYQAALRRHGPADPVRGVPVARPDAKQVCHYINGIATDDESGKRELLKAAVGLGAASRIREAYLFLALNYNDGDNVYLFGFSRGAFAVRSLAGFVGLVGVLFKDIAARDWSHRDMVVEAYDLYERRISGQRSYIASILTHLRTIDDERFRRYDEDNIPPIDIHFIGVWDTVRMLGAEALPFDVTRHWTQHHDLPQLPAHVKHARHALAIHETRPEFPPTVWEDWNETATKSRKAQTLEQAWFPGDHTDVGGGHDDGDDEHSHVTLEWIASEAGAQGLEFEPALLLRGNSRLQSGTVHHVNSVVPTPHGPRTLLRSWSLPTNKRLVQSFRMHHVTAASFLRPEATRFKPRDSTLRHSLRAAFDPPDDVLLRDTDQAALGLHMAVACVHDHCPVGKPPRAIDVACGHPDWWSAFTLEEVRGCTAALTDFLSDPEAGELEAYVTPLRAFLVCGMHAEVQRSLDATTDSVIADLKADPCSKPAHIRAASWSDRLDNLNAILAGAMKSHVASLVAAVRYEIFAAEARCTKQGGAGLRLRSK